MLVGLMALVVVFAFAMMTASCAKKQVKVGGAAEPSKAGETKAEAAKAGPAAAGDDKATDAEKKRRELEKAQKVAEFEAQKIYFDFDKSDLKPESKAVLKKKAEFLATYTEFALRIDGHCDERGTNEYNLALGERRANSAKQYLVDLGVSAHRISTVTYGEERPADPGHNEAAWSKNRRDEFSLIKRW
jgi:peptidoglycan-associated lipoprotein